MATTETKHPKIDPYTISVNQDYELDHITAKFRCTRAAIRAAIKAVGRSRRRVYQHLREINVIPNEPSK